MKRSMHRKGFSLIEIMVAMAIIALLSAIAIPSYILYARRSRISEAVTSIAAIKAAAEQRASTTNSGCFQAAAAHPAAVPSGAPIDWGNPAAGTGWDATGLGVRPNRTVWFQYQVFASQGGGATADECGTVNALGTVTDAAIGGANGATGCSFDPTNWVNTAITPDWYIVVARSDLNPTSAAETVVVGFIDDTNLVMCNDPE